MGSLPILNWMMIWKYGPQPCCKSLHDRREARTNEVWDSSRWNPWRATQGCQEGLALSQKLSTLVNNSVLAFAGWSPWNWRFIVARREAYNSTRGGGKMCWIAFMKVTWVWRNASQEPGLPPEETVVTCRQKNEAPPLITGSAYDDQVAHVVTTPTVDVTGKFLLTTLSWPMAEVLCRNLQSVLPVAILSDYQHNLDRILSWTELYIANVYRQ